MAGFSTIYSVGGLGGFMGADGINPIWAQILVGEGGRQWLEAVYLDKSFSPLGDVRVVIPEGPNHPNGLLDACIAFLPKLFRDCPTLSVMNEKLRGVEMLDFNMGKHEIPTEWQQLRREALPIFRSLNIFESSLTPLDLSKWGVQ